MVLCFWPNNNIYHFFVYRLVLANTDLQDNVNKMKQKMNEYESKLKAKQDEIYTQKLKLDELTSILAHVPKTPEPAKIEKRMGQCVQ